MEGFGWGAKKFMLNKFMCEKFLPLKMVGALGFPHLTMIFLQKHRDTNGRHIVMHIGGVCAAFCQEGGMLLQTYRDRNGRCIAILFKSIGVGGRFDWECKN